jgi:hypothetical protein
MILTEALQTKERLLITYKCGSVHRGRILRLNDCYYIVYNSRSLVGTKVDLDSISSIRYARSKVVLFRALGRR